MKLNKPKAQQQTIASGKTPSIWQGLGKLALFYSSGLKKYAKKENACHELIRGAIFSGFGEFSPNTTSDWHTF